MDEHAMTQGVIPVRHSSLPGVVKLPRRYEKAALGDPRTAKHRKISICGGPLQMRETISDRLDDLMTAIMWVKQELILLRQHDILLKRQFFNIHDSIQSLQPKKNAISTSSSLSPTSTATITMNGDITDHPLPPSIPESYSSPTSPARVRAATALKLPTSYSEYQLETFLVRPSASVTLLNSKDDDSNDSEEDDTFDDTYYRPRTSSMRTSRDLAALARRRGSKELI